MESGHHMAENGKNSMQLFSLNSEKEYNLGHKRKRYDSSSHFREKERKYRHHHHRSGSSSSSVGPALKTHKKENRRERSDSSRPYWDDKERHYKVQLRESLTPRYKVLSIVGEGTFGKVVECWDREEKKYVAVKIVRAINKYRDAAMIEIDILKDIAKYDSQKETPCIQLLSWFDFRGHICMTFDKYGLSLYDFMKRNCYQPFLVPHIREFSRQLIEAVAFMHDKMSLIHTDLKPENILLVDSSYTIVDAPNHFEYKNIRIPKRTDIKLIDFGSATFEDEHHTRTVSTRHYRAPEVILDLGWTFPCDIWSIGCILVEFYTGNALFRTHENLEHLALMEKILGNIPLSLTKKSKYFHHGCLQWPREGSSDNSSVRYVRQSIALHKIVHHKDFLDLVSKMLVYEPEKRITAQEALSHPFLLQTSGIDSKEAYIWPY